MTNQKFNSVNEFKEQLKNDGIESIFICMYDQKGYPCYSGQHSQSDVTKLVPQSPEYYISIDDLECDLILMNVLSGNAELGYDFVMPNGENGERYFNFINHE